MQLYKIFLEFKVTFQFIYVCTGDITVHMEPQGFMKLLAYLAPQLNIWKTILPMAVFFHLRVLNPSRNFDHAVVKWKE